MDTQLTPELFAEYLKFPEETFDSRIQEAMMLLPEEECNHCQANYYLFEELVYEAVFYRDKFRLLGSVGFSYHEGMGCGHCGDYSGIITDMILDLLWLLDIYTDKENTVNIGDESDIESDSDISSGSEYESDSDYEIELNTVDFD